MSSRREILVTITNLKKKRLLQPDSFWLFLAFWLSGFLAFLGTEKKLDFGLAEPVRRTNCSFLVERKVDRGSVITVSLLGLTYINKDVDIFLSSRKMFTPAKRSRSSKPVAPTKVLRTVGDGARIGKSRFACITLSDSEDEPREARQRPPAADAEPVAVAKAKPVVSLALEDLGMWGEDEYVLNPCTERWIREVESQYWLHKPLVYEAVPVAVEVEMDSSDAEMEMWKQPFAAALSLKNETIDLYDCRLMSDDDYAAFMTYLYAHGWIVQHEERRWVQTVPWNEPARVWVPPAEKAVVPRFCREAEECCTQDCRYVHGHTIPKVDRACGFGAKCGSSDPTGEKRALCIYMHPGEKWTAESCVHRH